MMNIEIKGLDKLSKNLKEFPIRFQKNVARGAIRAVAAAIAKEAKNKAPKETGKLKKSIKVVKRKSKQKNIVHFSVTPRLDKKHGYLAIFHEFGTRNMPSHPFMRPAFEKEAPKALSIVSKYIEKRMDKEITKFVKE